MISTRACALLGITHPLVLAGMAGGYTNPELAAAVSNAGGLGVIGVSWIGPDDIAAQAVEIRRRTDRPFGLNLLLFANEESIDAVLAARRSSRRPGRRPSRTCAPSSPAPTTRVRS